jgi:LuxR family maltose regulon positive regulatory protein
MALHSTVDRAGDQPRDLAARIGDVVRQRSHMSVAPSLPDPLVPRDRLLRRLDEITRRRVTCIAAPRGTGKSALVTQWCRERSELPVVWIDLPLDDELDAVRDALPGAAGVVLVVDRVDSLEAASSAMDVVRRLAPVGERVHVVLVGCCAPPELVALRMAGEAWQLTADEMRLEPGEVAPLVAACSGHPIPTDTNEELVALLDGWTAAAVLVGLSSSRLDRSARALYAAAGDTIDAYMSSVVLADLPADLREFVTATSCVDGLDPALCDVLIGRDGSEAHLARLRQAGFPIVHDDAGQARYLHPVRDALERFARRADPGAHAARLRLAAQWYREWNRPLDAAGCLVRMGEWLEAERIIFEQLPRILDGDEIGRLAEFARLAPPELLRDHVGTALGAAWVLRNDGRVSASYELLDIYAPHFTDRARMIADASRASAASWLADMEPLADFADAALAACDALGERAFDDVDSWHGDSSTSEYRARAHGAAQLACAYGAMWERGAAHLVPMGAEAAAFLPQFQLVLLHGITATFHGLSGRPADALTEAHTAIAVASQADLLEHRLTADAWFALGEALRLSLCHDEASDPFDRAQRLAEVNGRYVLLATAVAARAQLAVDASRPDAALDLIAGHRRLHPHRHPVTVAGALAAAEARAFGALLRHGDALRVLEQAPSTPPVASARVAALLATGDVAGAQGVVRDWPNEPTVDATVRRALAAAVICDHTGDRRRVSLIRTALDAAAPQQLGQPFVEHGPAVTRLLRSREVGDTELVRLLQRWLGASAGANAAVFTTREASVMSHIVAGHGVRETADALHISVNTVRAHLRAIHRKLGVDNRADAIRAWNAADAPLDG